MKLVGIIVILLGLGGFSGGVISLIFCPTFGAMFLLLVGTGLIYLGGLIWNVNKYKK